MSLTIEFPQVAWTVEFGGDEIVVAEITVTGGTGGGGGVSLGETSTTAYRGDRGKTAYDHSQETTGNPHGTSAADVGAATASDVSSAVSSHSAATDPHGDRAYSVQRANHTGTQAQSTVTDLVSDLAGKAATSHSHAASDVTSGTLATARLGSGTADGTTFLRGDGTWAAPSGGGSGLSVPAFLDVGQYLSAPMPLSHTAGSVYTTTATSVYITAYTPVWIPQRLRADRISIYCSTVATDAGAVLEVGYSSPSASGMPSSSATVLGQMSITGSPGLRELTISEWFDPGLVWLVCGVRTDGTWAGTNPAFYATDSAFLLGNTTINGNQVLVLPMGTRTANASISSNTISTRSGSSLPVLRLGLRVAEVA